MQRIYGYPGDGINGIIGVCLATSGGDEHSGRIVKGSLRQKLPEFLNRG